MELNLFMKLAGAFFIVIGSTLFGKMYANTFKERVEFLVDFNKRLEILKNEIGFMKGILSDTLAKAGEFEGKSKEFFKTVLENLEDMEAGMAWNSACKVKLAEMSLTKEDCEVIKTLGRLLGVSDVEGQLANIESISGQIDMLIDAAEAERKKNEPLFKSIGPIAGVGTAILLM